MGANLDRYQIIKGWMDKDGKLHENVYDVAWSAGRTPGSENRQSPRCRQIPSTSLMRAYTNTIGASELSGGMEGSGVRSNGFVRVLLRPCAGNPDPALDRL